MTRAAMRVRRGKEVLRTPSRFLDDLPEALTELVDLAGAPQGPVTEREKNFFASLKDKLKSGVPRGP
jgi:DNA helicase-2/ATP-dependent DNA helicase PcrA